MVNIDSIAIEKYVISFTLHLVYKHIRSFALIFTMESYRMVFNCELSWNGRVWTIHHKKEQLFIKEEQHFNAISMKMNGIAICSWYQIQYGKLKTAKSR